MAPNRLNVATPTKLTITTGAGASTQVIKVMFNPNTYSITKSVEWRTTAAGASNEVAGNAPVVSFGGGGSRELTLQLFFDSTENTGERDVRVETNKIALLTQIDPKLRRPPVCTVAWDARTEFQDFPFTGMISSLKQTFVLFDKTGTPLRATLDVTFVEFLNRDDDAKVTAPGTKQATARLGDSLPTISFDAFGDPTLWRTIADANAIEDPFALAVGSVLTLPKR